MALLQTNALSINFGGLWAVDKVDFEIDNGQIVGLIGPNGSGKTTFLNIVSGIYKATQGDAHLAGEEITGLRPFEVYQKGIARTYQSSRLCWDLSVVDNLLVGTYTSQTYTLLDTIFRPKKVNNEIYDNLQASLDMLSYFNPGLIDRRYDLAKNIPHIDRRRIEITRALMSKPKVLLLDEPTAGLNDEETMTMMNDIRKIKEKMQNIAIIIIEHDMKVMEEVPERIVVFNAGAKIFEGVYKDMLQDKGVVDAYIGGADA
ncbi:MAG: ABC transporter ATP-binding protein [Christensenellaceae bacterium]|jgi:ABC-type branched-subunit amino acid transport system ATPase component|nr:ABC transporter ATP-binding protein [Christensenellaceae bacterium]